MTDATLIGVDGTTGATRKGMYALRCTGAQVANLVDLTDSTQWPTMVTYGLSEGCYLPQPKGRPALPMPRFPPA